MTPIHVVEVVACSFAGALAGWAVVMAFVDDRRRQRRLHAYRRPRHRVRH